VGVHTGVHVQMPTRYTRCLHPSLPVAHQDASAVTKISSAATNMPLNACRQWMDRGGGQRGGYGDGRGPYGGGDRAGGQRFASTGRGPGDDPLFPRGGGQYGREVSRFGRDREREREVEWEAERRRDWDRDRPMERGKQHKRWDDMDDDDVDAGMNRWNTDQGRGAVGVQRWDAGGGQQHAPYHQGGVQYTMHQQQQYQAVQYGMYNAAGVTYAMQASMGAVTGMQQPMMQSPQHINPYSGGQQPMYRDPEPQPARQNPYAQYVPNGQYGGSTGAGGGGGRYASTGASGSSRHGDDYSGRGHQWSSSGGQHRQYHDDRGHRHHDSRSRSPSRG
jgi:hypothetical protein